ncbi:crotonase/enoyl-CoA hydratase family protein [Leptospira wolffii]|uniref:crotonase/enoyl-CoA hydratase family protein n=1 Tax=Leptospira wolffii TaxID=409998 RepID=UPI001082B1EF|nr:crotonase/enoyl-CoA hydratase family protein [Leptospira wolffii]TGK55979.1 crotonase/enoyl-CoA hydratase family protein [Leptospira wolffii]TGK72025.1 crotonase/enoyl-CoA hydratase family protein [Leptospira wolffii]TGK73690.1 crotonase/enoyl-CoA hydratase family protein [Leptospira wolffii]TGL27602.1 crotonase/enoyl-CoA hydratase family protein [Leptospira wolffii]
MEKFIEREMKGKVMIIRINRPERNVFTWQMLEDLSGAYAELEDNQDARVGLLVASGKHFTLGLELDSIAEKVKERGEWPLAENGVDPFGINLKARPRTKPIVAAAQGFCFTLGIELLLAADIRLAATKTMFSQFEVRRGIMPLGGASVRMVEIAGWGNAMRYLLTGEEFGAEKALQIGLIQEVVEKDKLFDRAYSLAQLIAEQCAPLALKETLASARLSIQENQRVAFDSLMKNGLKLFHTEDSKEGVLSFLEKRSAVFQGK